MLDGLYRHRSIRGLIVRVKNGCLIELVREPQPGEGSALWSCIREEWTWMILDKRPFSKEEEDYFIYLGECHENYSLAI